MPETEGLSRLSCTRCKERKVRCNRALPQCSRCKAHNAECVFPERVKRRTTRPDLSGSTDSPALTTILERLQKLEQQKSASSPGSSVDYSESRRPSAQASTSPSSTSPATSLPWTTYLSPSERSQTSISAGDGDIDAAHVIADAINRVQKLKLQSYATSVITDSIHIPTELAKSWIHNYFTHVSADMFLSLVNRDLIEMMPDIINLPHIHVESSILIIYHCFLFFGCTLNASNTSIRSVEYVKPLYLCCLRALPGWRREATGTTMDFIAALFMTRLCTECFDFELSWQMYKLTCEYAQGLNLHNLDGENYAGNVSTTKSDEDRRGFWQLIQIDLCFRLVLNKPPSITGNAWKVNLPWLASNSQPPEDGLEAIAFIVSSRITMIVIRFFALLEDETVTSKSDLRTRTEGLCQEMMQLYSDWQLNPYTADESEKEEDILLLCDVLLTGYVSVIFMLRKLDVPDSSTPEPILRDAHIPDSPIAVEASRKLVLVIIKFLELYPTAQTFCGIIGPYGGHVPIACLYANVLRAQDIRTERRDVELLERLYRILTPALKEDRDMYPLIRGLETLDQEVNRRMMEAQHLREPCGLDMMEE